MLPELQECIKTAQDRLYHGFLPTESSGIQWLDSVCGDLHRLLRIVHKHLIFDGNGNVGVLETCFLCISQIVMCIRWLEKTISSEMDAATSRKGLPQARQCFLDRIIWCLERLKSVLETEDSPESVADSNFVSYLDLALSLIAPLTVASEEVCAEDEYETKYNEVIVESGRIRSVVEALISQTFGFCNVLPDVDRKRITNVCQKVLKECLALEREKDGQDSSDRKLRVSILESAIYQLETHVNECLIRLVYDTFGDTDRRLLAQLRTNISSNVSEEQIEELTKPFDSYVERLMQIGLFAISYADNLKISAAIRSCLASLEALDSYLIPSLYVGADSNSVLLENHWLEESSNLCVLVHKIIDTNAFALSLIELLDGALDELQAGFNIQKALEMVRKGEIFLHHLEINSVEVNLQEKILSLHYGDYRTMVLECRAIVKCAERDATIDSSRIVKRFRVLQAKLRKIQMTISNCKDGKITPADKLTAPPEYTPGLRKTESNDGEEKAATPQESSPERREIESNLRELFSATQQLRMSSSNILYQSRRGLPGKRRLEVPSLLELNSFTDIVTHRRERAVTTPEKGSIRKKPLRRNSLRVAMFKKQQRDQTAELYESIRSDIDLQITDILDELTDLSNTFSTHASRKLSLSKDIPSTTTIRKSITNEEIAIVDDNKIRINIYTDI
ncbi:serendipity locus protein alpha-like [Anopheles maculipalpis]|uniref:serendipity locus protein alpha-like n=1 Tax=Anopheles maculipalpis TaxID=1496333 RepID=UPI002159936C|nr:serendipity locus protein alpha-like [Anopheles maculipalpis]